MEAADRHLNAALAQRPCDIQRARKLIRLHADEHHHSLAAGLFDHPRQAIGADASVRLIEGMDLDGNVVAEDAAGGAITSEAVERRE